MDARIKDTAIFIDLENVYYGLKKYHMDPDHPEEQHNLFLQLQNHYSKESIRMIEAYADFEQMELSMMSLQKKRVHIHQVYGNGREGKERKNAADIQLCLDAMEVLYQIPEIKTFVIVSADQDMIPLLDRLWSKGKRVELFCLCDESLSKTAQLHEFCDDTHNLFEFLNIHHFQNLSSLDRLIHNAVVHIYEWYHDPNNRGKSYGSTWIKNDFVKKFHVSEIEANQLFTKLLKGKYISPIEIEMEARVYYGYKVNLGHPQVEMIVKIAGYKVS
ncbi:NYN domain-containing protein [Hazenella sp. IB182357]|uniref:NYN domain-containing protein n=1 Tax=Polycladospora coralii TaxID=2771432 RepID=A0A926N4S9_9BACL|nr:NYN domain-containing protein [Polycladospora coralii]MBD1370954.1 NYN domain-containing protein [Polycladospora coralii]MBS7529893.1 NYN domain-containing protein [Polycladospora coralii]